MSYPSVLKNKWTKFCVTIVVGIVCLYYVVNNFNWKEIWQSLQAANLIYLFFGSAINILAYFFVRTIRWYLLLKNENLNVPFTKLYLYNSVSIGLSTVTPFQSGEALKVELLRKYGCGRLAGYTIFFLERILDFSVVIGLAIVGVSLGFNFGVPRFYFYIFATASIVLFLSVLSIVFLFPSERLNPLRNLLREKWQRKWTLLAAVVLTVVSWLIVVLGWKIALASVAVEISFWQAISLVTLTTLLVVISFVPGAIGVAEVSISSILMKMGIANSAAQTGAISVRGYALVILALTLIHWIVLKFIKKTDQELSDEKIIITN